jgi:L-cysteate sulfo-lyase
LSDLTALLAGHAGPACGVPHEATVVAIPPGASLEGLVLDPVYSAKGLAGLIVLIRAGRWTAAQDVVFIHTGGAPALFAYRHLLS